jgi:heme exporter protein D
MKEGGLSAFLAMGGYGFYVWTSYLVAAIAVAVEIISVRARKRAAMKSARKSGHRVSVPDDIQ